MKDIFLPILSLVYFIRVDLLRLCLSRSNVYSNVKVPHLPGWLKLVIVGWFLYCFHRQSCRKTGSCCCVSCRRLSVIFVYSSLKYLYISDGLGMKSSIAGTENFILFIRLALFAFSIVGVNESVFFIFSVLYCRVVF